ncbi:MAG TPA: hypothetical protein VHT94_07380 [Streptosporangiaceae bacterium]|jgi:hypothetical protein|nr:hypothetical protein [Streptosporangiaceae bacterium]
MPALETRVVTVTIRYEVAGTDHASTVKLVEDHVQPALGLTPRGADYPRIRSSEVTSITTARRWHDRPG